ncbi:clostripain-related cysteine peptidase, partial [Candidatus Hodarchaeum mangrovi]
RDIENIFKWTIMVYMAADNNLEEAGVNDLQEMKEARIQSNICVIVEFDGWDSCLIQETDDLRYNRSQRFRIPGAGGDLISLDDASEEKNMGDPQTLKDFIEFSMNQYPAEYYCLIIWNHGLGWKTGVEEWTDFTKTIRQQEFLPSILGEIEKTCFGKRKNVCWDDRSFGDALTESELKSALSTLPEALDVIIFDACFMGCIEVAYAIREYAQFMVASEDSIGLSGFHYTSFLEELSDRTANSQIDPINYDPRRCAEIIVEESYSNMLKQAELSMEITQLGVIDLSKIQGLSNELSKLAEFIKGMSSDKLEAMCAELSTMAEFGLAEQIDILKVVEVTNQVNNDIIATLKADIMQQMEQTCVYQHYNTSLLTSPSGLTIYAPWSPELWVSDYSQLSAFSTDSGWVDAISIMNKASEPIDYSDIVISHENPSITKRIEENELVPIITSVHWNEKITLKLRGPSYTDFDLFMFDSKLNLIGESYGESYPETISYKATDGSQGILVIVYAYKGLGNFNLDATFSTSDALVEFIGCAGMFVTDIDNNSKIDNIQLVLAFDSPDSDFVKFHLKVVDHPSSFILEWNQSFIEGLEIIVLDLPVEYLYTYIESLIPSHRWECFPELIILEPLNWQNNFSLNPLTYLIKLSDLEKPIDSNISVIPGQIIKVKPLNPPQTSTPIIDDNIYEFFVIILFSLAIAGGLSYFFINRRLKTAYRKVEPTQYAFTAVEKVTETQLLAVCPKCGIMYHITMKTQICPTCQVKLQAIIR